MNFLNTQTTTNCSVKTYYISDRVQKIVQSYFSSYGDRLDIGSRWKTPKATPFDRSIAKQIGKYFDEASSRPDNPTIRKHYDHFAEEVHLQFRWALFHGMKFTFEEGDRYFQSKTPSQALWEDVEQNGHMYVFSGGNPHPILDRVKSFGLTANLKFRAVHDLFGHVLLHNNFTAAGEEMAWRSHAQMFSSLALPALTTETRGQNSWVNFGPHMFQNGSWLGCREHRNYIPPSSRPYAAQKACILPARFCDPGFYGEDPKVAIRGRHKREVA